MTVIYDKVISITYKNENEPGARNLIQVNAKFCISRARQPTHSQYTLHGEILESVPLPWGKYFQIS